MVKNDSGPACPPWELGSTPAGGPRKKREEQMGVGEKTLLAEKDGREGEVLREKGNSGRG